MTLCVEQLEPRDCPSSAVDLWRARYADLSNAELRAKAADAAERARGMIAQVEEMRARDYSGSLGRFRQGADLLKTPLLTIRLREVRAEMQALTQLARQRGR